MSHQRFIGSGKHGCFCFEWIMMNESSNGKIFPCYWLFGWRIHRSQMNSLHKGQWGGTYGWVSNNETGDLRRHRAHYDVTVPIPVMRSSKFSIVSIHFSMLFLSWYFVQCFYHNNIYMRVFMLLIHIIICIQLAKFMGPTWGPPGSCWLLMGPTLAPWTLLSGYVHKGVTDVLHITCICVYIYAESYAYASPLCVYHV